MSELVSLGHWDGSGRLIEVDELMSEVRVKKGLRQAQASSKA